MFDVAKFLGEHFEKNPDSFCHPVVSTGLIMLRIAADMMRREGFSDEEIETRLGPKFEELAIFHCEYKKSLNS